MMPNVIEYEPAPFCDFCGRTVEQLDESSDYLVVSNRNRHSAICTVCVSDIVDAVVRKAKEDGRIPEEEGASEE